MRTIYRAVIFFARNPEEELSTEDMQVKWGLTNLEVRNNLRQAVREGLVSRVRVRDGSSRSGMRTYYQAGPVLKKEVGRAGNT